MVLSIVILSYNTKDLVINCLKSLMANYKTELENDSVEVIVVDNASSDDSFKIISDFAKNRKNINVFESGENLGFGKGCNFGEDKAKGEFVLFLNSDTEVKDKSFLEMTKFLRENPNVGILGGKLYYPSGSVQKSVGRFYTLFNFFIMILGFERLGFLRSSPNKIQKVDWVSGACLMVNKKSFDNIGRFDKNIFMYVEDMELCFRAKKEGFETYFYPNGKIIHSEHGSSNRTFAIKSIYEALLYFYKKHMPYWQYLIVKIILEIKATFLILFGKIFHRDYFIKTYGESISGI